MAEKKVIEIDVNTKDAVKSMENLSKATHDVSASFEEVYGDLQPLTARMGEAEDRLYELANAGKTTTKEYKDLLKTVGDYRKVQIKTDMAVDAAASTMGQKLGGALNGISSGFSIAQGAMGAFGVESEQVEGALLKVQSAMAIQQGIEGVRESIKSFKALGETIKATSAFQKVLTAFQWLYNTAMAANPVVAIVAGLAALVAVGYKLVTMFMDSSEANEKAAAATKRNTEALAKQKAAADKAGSALQEKNGHEYNMAKAAGKSAEALRKLALKHADEQIALEEASVATARNTYEKEKNTLASYKMAGMSDEVIAKQRELVTKTREALKEEYADLKAAYKNRRDVANQNQVEVQQEITDANNERIQAEKEKNDKLKDLQKEQHDKAVEALEEIKKNNKEATDVFKSEYDKQVRDVKDKYDAQIALAKKYKQDTTDLEAAKAKELKDLEDRQIDTTRLGLDKVDMLQAGFVTRSKESQEQQKKGLVGIDEVKTRLAFADSERYKKEVEEAKAAAEQKAAIQQQGLDTALQGVQLIKGLFEKSKGVQKAAVIAESAIGIAKMVIANKLANVGALATPQSIATSGAAAAPVIAMNNISTGIGIAANIAATAKALKTLGGGTPPTDPTGGGGGGTGGGAGSVMSPSFNVVGNSGINQLAQLQQQPTKAYVVSGEVTSAQSLDRNRIENATLVK